MGSRTTSGRALAVRIGGPDGAEVQAMIKGKNAQLPAEVMPRVWDGIDQMFAEYVMVQQFEAEGEYMGRPWQDLDPAYVDRKAREGNYEEIGKRSGDMHFAITSTNADGHIFEVLDGGWSAEIGVEVYGWATGSSRSGAMIAEDYSHHFNEIRPIYGEKDKRPPPEVDFAFSRFFGAAHQLALRTKGWAPDNFRGRVFDEFPGTQLQDWVDDFIDEMELGAV